MPTIMEIKVVMPTIMEIKWYKTTLEKSGNQPTITFEKFRVLHKLPLDDEFINNVRQDVAVVTALVIFVNDCALLITNDHSKGIGNQNITLSKFGKNFNKKLSNILFSKKNMNFTKTKYT